MGGQEGNDACGRVTSITRNLQARDEQARDEPVMPGSRGRGERGEEGCCFSVFFWGGVLGEEEEQEERRGAWGGESRATRNEAEAALLPHIRYIAQISKV